MIEQAVSEILHSLTILCHIRNANDNCRSRLNDGYAQFVGIRPEQAELIQFRLTKVPALEAALVVRQTLAAARPILAGTEFEAFVIEGLSLIGPTLDLRLREASLLGLKLNDVQLLMYSDCDLPDGDVNDLIAEIRKNDLYSYPFELHTIDRRLQKVLTEYMYRDLPLKKYLCAYHGGDRNWQPVTVEATDQFRARKLAIAQWLGTDADHVGIHQEWEMRHTSMVEAQS